MDECSKLKALYTRTHVTAVVNLTQRPFLTVLQPSDCTTEYAIKKFKPFKEGDPALQSGISQSACREIALCRELSNENIVALEEVMLDQSDRSIYMVFEYCEHDLLVCVLCLLYMRNNQCLKQEAFDFLISTPITPSAANTTLPQSPGA
jgi:serine/threonine protein kinase